MRKQLVWSVEEALKENTETVLILGDIGVFGFRNAFTNYPSRVLNIGILEQSTISLSAGMAKVGLIPIVHTIAPFLVERCFEQLKIDFGYQNLAGNFISVGNSYDYASLGCTHHCPADIGLLKNIPGFELIVPGTSIEFKRLFAQTYSDMKPTYYRLSERENSISFDVNFGQAVVIKKGLCATIIAVGTSFQSVYEAAKDMDVTILYYTTVLPFDYTTLQNNISSTKKIILCEPYYEGALSYEICKSMTDPFTLHYLGIPIEFIDSYGKMEDIEEKLRINTSNVKERIKRILNE